MGGVINLIKKLFSGIFSFIGGILGGKSGYFMELDEADSPKPTLAKAEAPKKAEIETAKTAVAATVTNGKSAAKSVVENGKSAAKGETAKSAKAKSPKAEPVKVETAETNGSTNGAKPPVVAERLNLPQPTVSFATEYLVPKPTNTRRRPGANMGSFLQMAKTVKTPNN